VSHVLVMLRTSLSVHARVQVVAGLDEALLSMQSGGVRRVYIPGPLAFPKGLPSGPGRCVERVKYDGLACEQNDVQPAGNFA